MSSYSYSWDGGNYPVLDTTFLLTTDIVTGLLATFGNLFSLLVIRATPETAVPDGTKVFMLTLTSTDFLTGTTYIISLIIRATEVNKAGIFICKGNAVVQLALFVMSIYVLVFIGVDRYLAVTRPLRYITLMTKRRAIVSSFTVCFLAMASAVTISSIYGVMYEPYILGCYPRFVTTDCTVSAVIHFTVILLPNAILVGIYTKLIGVSHHHAVRIRQLPVTGHSSKVRNDRSPNPPEVRSFAERKALQMFLLVNLALLVTWLPRCIAVLHTCYVYDNFDYTATVLLALSYFTTSSSSWVNPIIYTLTSKMFRKNALKLLKCYPN